MITQQDFVQENGLYKIKLGDIHIKGISMAGIQTHISVPELKICFDVGYSDPSLGSHKNYFITHGHMDHASGIPYLISNRSLNKLPPAAFYMPDVMIEPMDKIMKIWSEMEGHEYKWDFRKLGIGEFVEINSYYRVRKFKSFHRVESQGYVLQKKLKSLLPEFRDASSQEIIAAKKQGLKVESMDWVDYLAVTGDTKIEFLTENPELYNCQYLVVECTYATDVKSIESCREWGHIHFDELNPLIENFKGKKIFLKHFSRRHKYKEILKVLDEKCRAEDREKLLVLPW